MTVTEKTCLPKININNLLKVLTYLKNNNFKEVQFSTKNNKLILEATQILNKFDIDLDQKTYCTKNAYLEVETFNQEDDITFLGQSKVALLPLFEVLSKFKRKNKAYTFILLKTGNTKISRMPDLLIEKPVIAQEQNEAILDFVQSVFSN